MSELELPSKQKSLSKVCLQKNDDVTFEAKGNCEIFKSFFANLSANLVNGNVFGIDSVNTYYSNLNLMSKSFHLTPTSFEIVLKLLQEINPAKAAGTDKIGGRFLKDGAPVLVNPIKQLCNLSIKLSKFPEKCKIALLKPLFKKGSLVSKIFEKVVQDKTQTYLDRNNILYKFQSGFRQNYFTYTALSYLTDKIQCGFDEGFFIGMILIDLQNAVDTIDHNIFLNKVRACTNRILK